jgi:predicted HD superfamily hydrolase involved in NAD metabolism
MKATLTYTSQLEERVEAWAKAKIEPNRITHVEGVVETADRLARLHAPDEVQRVRLAGWIHDAAKHWSGKDLLDYAESHGLPVTEAERETPMLLHGAVGYALAAEVFGFDDPSLESACAYHTTGSPDMNRTDMIVYLADMIEPSRDFPGVDVLRAEAERDLEAAMLHATDHTIRHLLDKQKLIDSRALLLHNRLISAGVRYGK